MLPASAKLSSIKPVAGSDLTGGSDFATSACACVLRRPISTLPKVSFLSVPAPCGAPSPSRREEAEGASERRRRTWAGGLGVLAGGYGDLGVIAESPEELPNGLFEANSAGFLGTGGAGLRMTLEGDDDTDEAYDCVRVRAEGLALFSFDSSNSWLFM